jgi:hypothetical protein
VEAPWQSSLETDLASLEPGIQKACFTANRARRGTEIILEIDISASRKAVIQVVTQKFPAISDCIRSRLNAYSFSQASRGGSVRWRLVAR